MPMSKIDHRKYIIAFAILLLTVSSVSCSRRPASALVSGQVLIDGQPLPCGQVTFIPANGRPARAEIASNGRFTLSTYDDADGVLLGHHQIAVTSKERTSPTQIKWHVPKKYGDYRTSGLEETISGPTDQLVINLTWGGEKPFTETDDLGQDSVRESMRADRK